MDKRGIKAIGIQRSKLEAAEQRIAELERQIKNWETVTGFSTPEETINAVNDRFARELPDGLAKELWRLERKENEERAARIAELEDRIAFATYELPDRGRMEQHIAKLERDNDELCERLNIIEDSALELLDAIRMHWKIEPDQMDATTLYLVSLMAGFAREWKNAPPSNGFVHSVGFDGIGRIEIDVHRVDGKSAAESMLDLQSERDRAREAVAVMRAALEEFANEANWFDAADHEGFVPGWRGPNMDCPEDFAQEALDKCAEIGGCE